MLPTTHENSLRASTKIKKCQHQSALDSFNSGMAYDLMQMYDVFLGVGLRDKPKTISKYINKVWEVAGNKKADFLTTGKGLRKKGEVSEVKRSKVMKICGMHAPIPQNKRNYYTSETHTNKKYKEIKE